MSSTDTSISLIERIAAKRAAATTEHSVRATQWKSTLDRIAERRARDMGINRARQERAVWEKILDVISTGNYAAAGAALAIKRGDPDVWQSIVQGVRDRTSFIDVAREAGAKGGWAIGLGLIGDIFLDPTTYIPGFGATAKGKAVGNMIDAMRSAGVVTKSAQAAYIANYVNKMPNPREQRILRDAVAEGAKTLYARTFPERVEAGLQRAFTIERPTGLFMVPKTRFTRMRLPTPIPKFETTGISLPFPKTVEVGFAKGVSALGAVVANTPGIKQTKRWLGDKFFGQMVRPEGSNPIIWEELMFLFKQFQRSKAGRLTALNDALQELGSNPIPNAEKLKKLGITPEGQGGELMHHIFREAFVRNWGPEEKRAMLLMIEEPERVLQGKNVNVAERILNDILVKRPSDKYFNAVVTGNPEDLGELIAKTTDVKGLQEAENKLERGIIYLHRAMEPYRQGVRMLDEPDYHLMVKQLQDLEAGAEEVRNKILTLNPPTPIKQKIPTVFPDMRPRRPPPIPPEVMTRYHGTGTEATAYHAERVARLQDLRNRMAAVANYGQSRAGSPGLADNANRALDRLIHQANSVSNELTAVEMDMLNSTRRAEEAKRLGEEMGTAVKREVQAIRSGPSMKAKAAEVLPEARAEMTDLGRQLRYYEDVGDEAKAAQILDRMQSLEGETLGTRLARLTEEGQLGVLEQRAMAKEFAQAGQKHVYKAYREATMPERLYLEAVAPPEALKTAERAARIFGTDLRGLQQLAATTSPLGFQERLMGAINTLSPQDVNQIGEDLIEAVRQSDLGEVHRLLRESMGLPPSELGLQLADLGLTEPEALDQIAGHVETALQRLRNSDPTTDLGLESVHVIGDYARGEGQIGRPIEVLAFVKTELDESTVALALQKDMNLSGALIPTEIQVTPFKLTPNLTKDEVLRAFGAAPPLGRGTEPELFPDLAAPKVPPTIVAQTPDPKVAGTLAGMKSAPQTKSMKGLIPLRKSVDTIVQQAKVLRTRRVSPNGPSRGTFEQLQKEMSRTRRLLDSWETTYYDTANNFEKIAYEKARRELNRYDPEKLTPEGRSAREAFNKAMKLRKKYKALPGRPAAPMTQAGMPIVNTKLWSPTARQLLTINRENAMEVLQANQDLLGTGRWIEYEANGVATGKSMADDEFMAAYSKVSKGQARTLSAAPDGVELDRAWHEVKFFPDTHTLEISDDAGKVYQRQLNIPLDPEAYPPSVKLATHKIIATLPNGSTAQYDSFDDFRKAILDEFSAEPAIKARFSPEAQDPEKWDGIRKGVDEFLGSLHVQTIGPKGGMSPARIRMQDLGLEFGPGGYFPRLVGEYNPWGHFRVGEFISLEGVPGQVISSPAQGIRRVQLQTGQVVDVHADDLKLATLRDISRNDMSAQDFILRAAMRPDGSISRDEVRRLLQGMERDRLISSVMADQLTENLVTGLPITPQLMLATDGIKSLLEGMWHDENSVGILTRHLNFYASRVFTKEAGKKKMRFFGSMPAIRMTEKWFQKHRQTYARTVEQMKMAYKAQGVESPWLDDVLVTTGIRGTADVKATEAARYLSRVITAFGKRIGSREIEAAMDGYSRVLRDVYSFPEERITKIESLVNELMTYEGVSRAGIERTGRAIRGMARTDEAWRLEQIERIRTELNELAPPMSFVVPKGAVMHYHGAFEGKTMDLLDQDAVLSPDQVQAIGALTQNAAMYEGTHFLEIPLDKVWAVRMLPKDVPAYILPKEVADAINGHLSNYADLGEDLNQFLRVFDIFQNYWKSWTLGIFPAYHFRNFVGNMWNMFLAGGLDAERMAEGGRFFSGNLEDFQDKYGRKFTQKRLEEIAYDGNLMRHGEYTIETRQTPEGEVREVSLKPIPLKGIIDQLRGKLPKKQIMLAIGERIGQRNEDWAKMSLLLDGLYKGMSPETAVERVHKYLFDYDALGSVERQIMPRLFPFYRWSRFNIPLQLEALLTRPAKFTGTYDAIKATRELVGEPPEERFLPEWMKNQVPIPVKKFGPGKYGYWVLGNWLPSADLVRAMDPAGMSGGMLTPILKAPYEYATNYSLFFKNQVERFPKETGQFLGIELRQRTVNALRNIRLLNEIDKLAFKKELPLSTRVVRTVFGRIYPVDYIDQAEFHAYRLNREESALKTSIIRSQKALIEARRKGEDVRAAQLKNHIRMLKADMAEIKMEQDRLGVSIPKKTAAQKRTERLERKLVEMGVGQ